MRHPKKGKVKTENIAGQKNTTQNDYNTHLTQNWWSEKNLTVKNTIIKIWINCEKRNRKTQIIINNFKWSLQTKSLIRNIIIETSNKTQKIKDTMTEKRKTFSKQEKGKLTAREAAKEKNIKQEIKSVTNTTTLSLSRLRPGRFNNTSNNQSNSSSSGKNSNKGPEVKTATAWTQQQQYQQQLKQQQQQQ